MTEPPGSMWQKEKEEKQCFIRMERRYGRFYRSTALPTAVNPEAVEADYENGVLSVRLPKAEESKPRRIAVPYSPAA